MKFIGYQRELQAIKPTDATDNRRLEGAICLVWREGFTQATHSAAHELDVRLVSLAELENTLATIYEK